MKNSRHWDVQGGPIELEIDDWLNCLSHFDLNKLMFSAKRRPRQFLSFVPARRKVPAWNLKTIVSISKVEESVGSALLGSSIYRGKLKIESVFRISFLFYWNKEIIVLIIFFLIGINFRSLIVKSKFLKETPFTIFYYILYLPFLNFFQL